MSITKKKAYLTDNIYFTSDHHFSHRLMTAESKNLRGFKDVAQMNEELIEAWNKVVPEDGIVFNLGDFFWTETGAKEILLRLNGAIHLLLGNHYRSDLKMAKRFPNKIVSVSNYLEIYVKEKVDTPKEEWNLFVLSHYPFITWDRSHYGSYHLHGHCHGNLTLKTGRRMDVGVDTNKKNILSPYTYSDVMSYMAGRSFEPVDHHVNE